MFRKILILLLLGSYATVTGCAVVVAGAGAGAGVYSYLTGELKRSYPVEYHRAVQASIDSLAKLKIEVTRKTDDGIQAGIQGKRTDGTPVTVTVVTLDPTTTDIGVRSGVVGVWDKKVSELIHATIAQQLL